MSWLINSNDKFCKHVLLSNIAQGKNIKLKERFMKTACTSFKCVNKYPFVEHRHKITSNGHSLLPSMTFFVQGNV